MKEIRIYPTEIYNYGGDVEWGMMHIAESKGLPCTNSTLMPRPDYEKIDRLYRWYDSKDDSYVFSWEEKSVDKESETL